ncbi:MAG: hypothetical protein DRI23_07760 [Candidatus Cloacimonadota bacterium]|nr:MAG: hypothetical protein DRI23_07760 [Candidatus Cloacimonadota bacterium]
MKSVIILVLFLTGTFTACSVLTLAPANFAWPIESVLKVNDEGEVNEERYSFSFDAKGLYYEEFEDSLAYLDRELRIIRDVQGYYFITGAMFKNVYVFRAYEGAMVLNNKILGSESGFQNPVFNQRTPHIELIDGEKILKLTHQGIEGDKK